MSAHSLLTIANAAKVSGLSPATLRRLDDRLKPARSEGGFRLYDFDAVMDYVANRKRGSRRRPWIDRVFCQSSASMPQIPDESVDLIVTSPPYAGRRGGVDPDQYVEWFSPFAAECCRVMKRHANFVAVIKEGAINGVRHQYVHDLVRDLTTDSFDWIDEYVWSKPCPLPKMPRDSLKDGFERCHLFGIQGVRDRMFFPDQVRRPLKPHHNTAPRARTTAGGFTFAAESFADLDGAYPSNVLHLSNANDGFRFRGGAFPVALADFFIRLLTPDSGAAIVLDPFCGSGTTLVSALHAGRHFVGMDNSRTAYHTTMARLAETREQLGPCKAVEDAPLAEAVG
jgi:hypothetical protein